MKKLGRNDPCPCGSGRKYKACCMQKENTILLDSARQQKYEESETELVAKLVKFISGPDMQKHYAEGVHMYFEQELADLQISQTDYNFFISWLIHDYPMNENQSVLDIYLEKQGYSLQAREKEIAEGMQKAVLMVYTVTRIEDDKRILLENAHTKEQSLLHDGGLISYIKQGDTLYTRIYRRGEQNKILGGSFYVPAHVVGHVLENIETSFEKQKKIKDFEQFMRRYSVQIVKMLRKVQTGENKIYNEDGELLQYCTIIYAILEEPNKLLKLLRDRTDIQVVGKNPIYLQWIRQEENGEIVRGAITVLENELKVEVDSFERKHILQEILQKEVGGLLEYKAEEYSTLQELQEEAQHVLQSDAGEKLPPSLQQTMVHKHFDEYYRKWMDQELQALEHHTPREHVKTERGKKQVYELLKSIEKSHQIQADQMEIEPYDFSWIYAGLHLQNKVKKIKISDDTIEKMLLKHMNEEYTSEQVNKAVKIWGTYKRNLSDKIGKPEGIAASIEYLVASLDGIPKTQKDIADKYHVSASTIAKRSREIMGDLDIKPKNND